MNMARPFIVTGLPRSRTAWMSGWLSDGACLCRHEPELNDVADLPNMLESTHYRFMGIADSGLGFDLGRILEDFQIPTVIVARPLEEVENSLDKLRAYFNIPKKADLCLALQAELIKWEKHPLVMTVPYRAMNDVRTMQRAFWHLRMGEPFDEERFKMFSALNIQVDVRHLTRRLMSTSPTPTPRMQAILQKIAQGE